ncbi:GtrA-like protein [Methylomusa anaerophila]|uniref:GtrA-like protein n=2 Tax=Methylomusa anaerophila TaxID=1930071 RepID=A0A348AKM7_9FIRM|nr:GtrA-like protein [Methylomusa anaerophila]
MITEDNYSRWKNDAQLWKKVIKFGIVGGMVTGVHGIVLAALVEFWYWNAVYATFVAFVTAFLTSYLLNSLWTFGVMAKNKMYFIKFFAVAIVGLLLNVIIMYITTEVIQWNYQTGFFIGIIVVPTVSFSLNYVWTFR